MAQNFFAATGLVFNNSGEILMIKHKKLGVWMPPGGHVEKDELPCEAVVREVFEETGVRVKVITAAKDAAPPVDHRCRELPLPMEILSTDFEGDGTHNIINFNYLCIAESLELTLEEKAVDDIGWFTIAEALELDTFEFVRKSLQKAAEYNLYFSGGACHGKQA